MVLLRGTSAQAALDYLMTYGWAFILIASVVAVLVFVVSTPISKVNFYSSDPTKIMLKGGSVSGSDVDIILQNIAEGKIYVTKITLPASYSTESVSCLINGNVISTGVKISPGIYMPAGENLWIDCSGVSEVSGTIEIEYIDFDNLSNTFAVTITGSGTGVSPVPTTIQITDCASLQAIKDGDLTENYELASDIDCSASAAWNEIPENPGAYYGFKPIGSSAAKFTGSFNGNNFQITNLTINRGSEWSIGLFGDLGEGGEISNVGLTNANIYGLRVVGSLAGSVSQNAIIRNSYSTGSVTSAGDYVGGLVGTSGATISNTYSSANVICNGNQVAGGLIGTNYGSISKSYATGKVSGKDNVGGFVGVNTATCTADNYWNPTDSGQASSGCGTESTQADMKLQSTYTGWDFVGIWIIDATHGGYPYLQWE